MKTMITWTKLKQFVLIYCCVWGFNALLTILNADFDLIAQISPKSLLFNLLVSVFITLLILTRQKKPIRTNA